MEKRKIPLLNAEVSLLGFGLMRLPFLGGAKSKIDYPKAQGMIDRAYKAGVNYFDSAYVYHEKMSDVFAGDTLSKYPRDSYYLATKMPTWDLARPKEEAPVIFEEQLKKCKVDYFDFYLAHCLNKERIPLLRDGIYEYLCKMKEQGKIRRLGFSFHDHLDVLKELLKDYKWDFVQIQLNYVDWDTSDAKSLYNTLTEHKVPVVVMEPVKGGSLANPGEKALDILKKAEPQASAATWALRFAASLPNVMTVLSGMSEPEQVEDNLKAFENFKPLDDAERKVLSEAAAAFRAFGNIPCTGCNYCMDCPSGVNIPRLLAQYNHYLVSKISKFAYHNQYRTLNEPEQAHNCTGCQRCETLCPQKINIHTYMEAINTLFAS